MAEGDPSCVSLSVGFAVPPPFFPLFLTLSFLPSLPLFPLSHCHQGLLYKAKTVIIRKTRLRIWPPLLLPSSMGTVGLLSL